jgi:20S proteasome subunit alpha 2
VQIEYALQAVAAGAPSMGIKAKNGVVLAVEKKQKSFLYDESSISKVCNYTIDVSTAPLFAVSQ